MSKTSFHILRVGLAITFLWIGILIFKAPAEWGTYLQPWAAKLLPVPVVTAMLGTATLDVAVGFLLLIGFWVWVAAILASLHLLVVLTTVGIDAVTVRDIGLLAGSAALLFDSFPRGLLSKIFHKNPTQP